MSPTNTQETTEQFVKMAGGVDAARNLINEYESSLYTSKQTIVIPDTEVIIRLENVVKKYKVGKTMVEALRGANLSIHQGEFVAITGSSGSGKGTLLQHIGGLDKPTSGTVSVQSRNLNKLSDKKLSKFRNQTIGFVFQFFYLQPFLNVQSNIQIPAMFAKTKKSVRNTRSAELASTVGIGERLHHLPRELSGGQMQRAAIARALQNNPSIILADEPTGNLDSQNASIVFDLFRSIADTQKKTIVVVTHDRQLAARADRVIEMRDGVVV